MFVFFWLSSDVNHQTKFLLLKIILSTSKMGKIYQFTNSAPQLRARYFLMRSQAISIWWSTLMKNPFKVSSSAELPIIKLWTCTFGICPSNIWKRENSENPRKLFVVQDKICIYFVGVGKIRIHTYVLFLEEFISCSPNSITNSKIKNYEFYRMFW